MKTNINVLNQGTTFRAIEKETVLANSVLTNGSTAYSVSKKSIFKTEFYVIPGVDFKIGKNRSIKCSKIKNFGTKETDWRVLEAANQCINLGSDKIVFDNVIDELLLVGFDDRAFDRVFTTGKDRVLIHKELGRIYKGSREVECICLSDRKQPRKSFEALLEEGYTAYKLLIPTDGSKRKGKTFLLRDDIDRIAYLNHISHDMYKVFACKNNGVVTLTKLVKFLSRMSLIKSPGVNASKVNGLAFFKDGHYLFGCNDSENFIVDGLGVCRASYGAKIFNLRNKREAEKTVVQCRIKGEGLTKCQLMFFDDKAFEAELRKRIKAGEIVIPDGVDIDEFITKSNFMIDGNALKAATADGGAYITAMAMGKDTDGHLSRQFLEKLIYCAAKLGKDRLEKVMSHLKKLADENIAEGLERLMTESDFKLPKNISKKGKELVPYINDVLKAYDATNPAVIYSSISQFANSVAKLAEKLSLQIRVDGHSLIKNRVALGDFLSKMLGERVIKDDECVIGKISRKIEKSEKIKDLFSDAVVIKYPSVFIMEFLSLSVLPLNEVIGRVKNTGADEETKKHVIRILRNLPDASIILPNNKEIIDLLAGMDFDFDKIVAIFDKEITSVFKDYVAKFGKEGLKIEPAAARVEAKTVTSNLSKLINSNEKLSKFKTLERRVPEVRMPMEDGLLADDMFHMINRIKNKESIGVVTEINDRTIAVLQKLIQTGNIKYFEEYIKGIDFETKVNYNKDIIERNNGSYKDTMLEIAKGLKYTDLNSGLVKIHYQDGKVVYTVLYVDEMLKTFMFCNRDLDDCIEFLLDCSRVLRLVQEGTIDSAKTAIYLTNRIICSHLLIKSLMPIEVKREAKTDGAGYSGISAMYLERSIKRTKKVNKLRYVPESDEMVYTDEQLDVCILSDLASEVQDHLVDSFNTVLRPIFEMNSDSYKYNDEQTSMMNHVYNVLLSDENGKILLDTLQKTKSLYISDMIETGKMRNEVDPDSENGEMNVISEIVKSRLDRIRPLVKDYLEAMELSTMFGLEENYLRGAVLHAVGCCNKGEIDKTEKNKFAATLFPEYSMSFLIPGGVIQGKGKILQLDNEELIGTEVELKEGYSSEIVVKEDYTGKVKVIDKDTVVADVNLKAIETPVDYSKKLVSFAFTSNEIKIEDYFNNINLNSLIRFEFEDIKNRRGEVIDTIINVYGTVGDVETAVYRKLGVADIVNIEIDEEFEDKEFFIDDANMMKVFLEKYKNHKTSYELVDGLCLSVTIAE